MTELAALLREQKVAAWQPVHWLRSSHIVIGVHVYDCDFIDRLAREQIDNCAAFQPGATAQSEHR
jgi:hypothetical protein